MILITGDTHGEYDVQKLSNNSHKAAEKFKGMTKDDYLIICGDFGFVWDGSKTDTWWLNWLEEKPYTTLFIDGNHENFDLLNAYPTENWHGGTIHRIMPSVLHLMRGQVFTLQGRTFFTMGGAESHDLVRRMRGKSWWQEELPCSREYKAAWQNLNKHKMRVDYILTHSLPSSIQQEVFPEDLYAVNHLTDFLDEVQKKVRYRAWYTGHYHLDGMHPDYPRIHLIYDNIKRLL